MVENNAARLASRGYQQQNNFRHLNSMQTSTNVDKQIVAKFAYDKIFSIESEPWIEYL